MSNVINKIKCLFGFHKTFVWKLKMTNKENSMLVLGNARSPIMTCPHCDTRVNKGLPDEYFHGDKGLLTERFFDGVE